MSRAPLASFLAGLGLFAGLALPAGAALTPGPDVALYDLFEVTNHGSEGGIRGYSIGTTACNGGDQPVNWCDNGGGCGNGTTNHDHPAIAQNLYRLKNGRFEQLGASWLKHGFASSNDPAPGCGLGSCVTPPLGGDQLGVGCTDPYGSGLNGSRPLGRKSEVDATTGAYPYPPGGGGSVATVWNQRIAVAESDLDPALNAGALYYLEGHYVAPDDAMAGNGLNNASYRQVTVTPGSYTLVMAAPTARRRSAIQVWQTLDSAVELVNLDVPSTPIQRFHIARKATDLGGGMWHYEYAVHNMNSDRAADQLLISFGDTTTFSNIGFHDVDAHSGEPYDTTNWESATTGTSLSWTAPFFSPAQNANALRWATTYSFWFDANRSPNDIAFHRLRLFEAGQPAALDFWLVPQATPLFADGFESGNTINWSSKTGLGAAAPQADKIRN